METTNNDIRISIIIPIYNTEDYLAECLDSVEPLRRLCAIEVIMVDDGSTDGSAQIARSYADRLEDFHYFYKENEGVSIARNFGVQKAHGKYLTFVDADDLIIPDVYREMAELGEAQESDMVLCQYTRKKGNKYLPTMLGQRAIYGLTGNKATLEEHPNFVFDTISCSKLIRRTFFLENGITFPAGCVYAEDTPPMLQCHHLANHCSVVFKVGYLYRIRTGESQSISQHRKEKRVLLDKLRMLGECFDYCREKELPQAVAGRLQWKVFAMDLMVYIKLLRDLPADEAAENATILSDFVRQYAAEATFPRLAAIHQEVYKTLLAGDLPKLIKVTNFWQSSYGNVPFLYGTEGAVTLRLPSDLFDRTDYPADHERDNTPPECKLLEITTKSGSPQSAPSAGSLQAEPEHGALEIRGQLYQKRVQTCEDYPQQVSAYLMDPLSGNRIPLGTEVVPTPALTEEKGIVICHGDHVDYHYNYDRGGFCVHIDLDALDELMEEGAPGGLGAIKGAKEAGASGGLGAPASSQAAEIPTPSHRDYPLFLQHRTVLTEGFHLLKGYTPGLQKKHETWKYYANCAVYSLRSDESGSLFLRRTPLEQPRITVVLIADNADGNQRSCLTALRQQTWQNTEIRVIVSPETPEDARTICTNATKADNRIRLVQADAPSLAAGLSTALLESKGDYVFLTRSADLAAPECLKTLYQLCQEDDAPMAVCAAKRIKKPRKKYVLEAAEDPTVKPPLTSAFGTLFSRETLTQLAEQGVCSHTDDPSFWEQALQAGPMAYTADKLYCTLIPTPETTTPKTSEPKSAATMSPVSKTPSPKSPGTAPQPPDEQGNGKGKGPVDSKTESGPRKSGGLLRKIKSKIR